MSNLMTDALALIIDAQETLTELSCDVTIGKQVVKAVVRTDPYNPVIVDGAVSESGMQMVMVDKALLTSFATKPNGEPPINTTPTIVRGIKAFVLAVNNVHGVLHIQTGFPDAGE